MTYETKVIKNIEQLTRRLSAISNDELTEKEVSLIKIYLNNYKEYLEDRTSEY